MLERRAMLAVAAWIACAGCSADKFAAEPSDGGAIDASREGDVPAEDDSGVPILARDEFARSTSNGLGTADVGGAWSTFGDPTSFSVTDGSARVALAAPSATRACFLGGISTDDADVQATIWTDKVPTGNGAYAKWVTRRIDDSTEYGALAQFHADGSVSASLIVDPGKTILVSSPAVLTVVPSEQIRGRFQATGTSPTHLRFKLWKAQSPEPTAWLFDVVDSTAVLQVKASIGMSFFLAANATNAPLTVLLADFVARPATRMP